MTIGSALGAVMEESFIDNSISRAISLHYGRDDRLFFLKYLPMMGLYETALQNMGVVSLPCFLADPDPRLTRLIEPPKALTSELWLLTHVDLRRTARVRAIMDFLKESLEKE